MRNRNQIVWVNDPIKELVKPLERDKKKHCIGIFVCKCHGGGTYCSPNNK